MYDHDQKVCVPTRYKKIILGAGKLTWMMIGLHEQFNFTRNSASQSIFVKSVKQY